MRKAGHYITASLTRLGGRPSIHPPADRSLFERPLVVLGVYLVSALIVMRADYALGVWMQAFPEGLRPVTKHITGIGEGIEVLVVSGLILILCVLVPKHRMRNRVSTGLNSVAAKAAYVFMAVAGGGLLASLVKNAIGRARPSQLAEYGSFYFKPLAFDADFASFPSGHSATAGAMAISLALVFPKYRPCFGPVGALICISRQLLGAHWCSDTLMGWAVGAAFALWLAHVFAARRLLFTYNVDGCLRPRRSRRSFASLVTYARTKIAARPR